MFAAAETPLIKGARLDALALADLKGWENDNHNEAFQTFLKSCARLEELRPAKPVSQALKTICQQAPSFKGDAKTFFETYFTPYRVTPETGNGFLTGYFEPDYAASLTRTRDFQHPLLARPDDLVTLSTSNPSLPPELRAARRTRTGLEPYPDRAAIEANIEAYTPIAWLRNASESFIIHVQGSARLTLPNGETRRIAYAGRNGHAYTSIGKRLVEQGLMDRETMSLEGLMTWLDTHPSQAKAIMQQNRSYIFFRIANELKDAQGPIGGAGLSLTPMRSLAVDRNLWSYHLPIWLDGTMINETAQAVPFQRLMIAQDTGSAILGPARGDFFYGSGREAGTRAGMQRHKVSFTVLWPVSR